VPRSIYYLNIISLGKSSQYFTFALFHIHQDTEMTLLVLIMHHKRWEAGLSRVLRNPQWDCYKISVHPDVLRDVAGQYVKPVLFSFYTVSRLHLHFPVLLKGLKHR